MKTNETIIEEPYGFIYITTNLVNGKKYLGQKSFGSNSTWKQYLGSGIAFSKALKKYGKESFIRNIVCFCMSPEELNQVEYDLSIFLNVVESDDWYNLVYGGNNLVGNANPMYGRIHSQETIEKMKQAANNRSEETLNKIKQKAKERFSVPENNPMFGKHHSKKTISKISDKAKERYKDKKNHPMFNVHRFGVDSPRHIPIICVDTKVIYDSAATASIKTGIDNSVICKCWKGIYKTAGGFKWLPIYDITLKNGKIIFGALTLGIITKEEYDQLVNNSNNDLTNKSSSDIITKQND